MPIEKHRTRNYGLNLNLTSARAKTTNNETTFVSEHSLKVSPMT